MRERREGTEGRGEERSAATRQSMRRREGRGGEEERMSGGEELGIRGGNAGKKIFALFMAKGVDIVSDVCYGYAIMEILVLRRLAVPAFFVGREKFAEAGGAGFFCGTREVCGDWRCRLFFVPVVARAGRASRLR